MTRPTFAQTFAHLRQNKQLGLSPFIPAAYPDLATTTTVLPALAQAGANFIEVGFPFSDPIADGPTIQAAFSAALKSGAKVKDIFAAVQAARDATPIPLVAMVSYSIAFRYNLQNFLTDAKSAGFDAILFPDLPPPEAQPVAAAIRNAGLDTVLLIAPSTSEPRRREIADLVTGFIYYLSVAGITGERNQLPHDLTQNLQNLRKITDKPLAVGFGIHKPEHLAQLAPHADAAIIGSAIVKRMQQAQPQTPQSIAQSLTTYCHHLLTR